MNFDLSEEQQVVADLSAQLFTDLAEPDRVKAVTESDDFDRNLWASLADAGMLGLTVPESAGGIGLGVVGLTLLAREQGRKVAPVPLVSTLLSAMTLAEHFGDVDGVSDIVAGVVGGETIVTSALAEYGVNDPLHPNTTAVAGPNGVTLNGDKPAVSTLMQADWVLVPAMRDATVVLALVDTSSVGVVREKVHTTNHEPAGNLQLDAVEVPSDRVIDVPGVLDELYHRHLVGLAALQVGAGEGSVTQAAAHVSEREQFGRALSTFQAVSQRAADGYITNEGIWSTVINAAWQLDNQAADAVIDVLTAAWWASEATPQVVQSSQHLHAGIGADVDYPVHRQYLWGVQNASLLGSASSHLARLGRHLAAEPVHR